MTKDAGKSDGGLLADVRAALEGPPPPGPVTYVLTRRLWIFLLGVIFFVAFASLWPQVGGLIESRGILPAARLFAGARQHEGPVRGFVLYPSILYFASSDVVISGTVLAGMAASIALMMGYAPRALLGLLWALYLSLCTAGGDLLNYQWDILLLEAAFLTIFWAPPGRRPHGAGEPAPAKAPLFLLRFLLFRLMFAAGVVKVLDASGPWAKLTALDYHFLTAPFPTALGYYLHRAPHGVHAAAVVATLAIELLAPLFYFGPRRARLAAAASSVSLMAMITLTGSFAFFNLLTAVLCVVLLDDQVLLALAPARLVAGLRRRTRAKARAPGKIELGALGLYTTVLVMNTISGVMIRFVKSGESLPALFATTLTYTERFRTLNVYGLFEGIATERFDLVFEGSRDGVAWQRYERRFGIEPKDAAPRSFAPFCPRVELQLWTASQERCEDHPWLIFLQQRLLEGSPGARSIFADGPFMDEPPTYLRVLRRSATFTTPEEHDETGAFWKVGPASPFCPPFQLQDGKLVGASIPSAVTE